MEIKSTPIAVRIFMIEFFVIFGFLIFVRSSTMGLAVISMFFSPLIVLIFLFISLNYAAKYKWQKTGLNLLLGVNVFLIAATFWQVHDLTYNFHFR